MTWIETIARIRREYSKDKINQKNISNDPIKQFEVWFKKAVDTEFIDPNAMILSTATPDGKPSSRVVLIKQANEKGFYFFTNYESRKGKELAENPNASLLFYWDKLDRQVRIEGRVEKISFEESEEYFKSRPYKSKIGAWASRQSEVLPSRFKLLRKAAELMVKYPKNVPLPDFWGGYCLVPETIEFWQGRENRLHDRIVYHRTDTGWDFKRLYP